MEPGHGTPTGPLAVQVADLSVPQFLSRQTKAPSRLSAQARGSIQGRSGWARREGLQGALAMIVTPFPSLMEADQQPKVKVTATAGRKHRQAAPQSSPAAALPLGVLSLTEAQPQGRAAQGTSASPQGP